MDKSLTAWSEKLPLPKEWFQLTFVDSPWLVLFIFIKYMSTFDLFSSRQTTDCRWKHNDWYNSVWNYDSGFADISLLLECDSPYENLQVLLFSNERKSILIQNFKYFLHSISFNFYNIKIHDEEKHIHDSIWKKKKRGHNHWLFVHRTCLSI